MKSPNAVRSWIFIPAHMRQLSSCSFYFRGRRSPHLMPSAICDFSFRQGRSISRGSHDFHPHINFVGKKSNAGKVSMDVKTRGLMYPSSLSANRRTPPCVASFMFKAESSTMHMRVCSCSLRPLDTSSLLLVHEHLYLFESRPRNTTLQIFASLSSFVFRILYNLLVERWKKKKKTEK